MTSFLMLGIVPGTSIQIDFNTWLISMGVLCILLFLFGARRTHFIAKFRMARAIRHANPTANLMARLA